MKATATLTVLFTAMGLAAIGFLGCGDKPRTTVNATNNAGGGCGRLGEGCARVEGSAVGGAATVTVEAYALNLTWILRPGEHNEYGRVRITNQSTTATFRATIKAGNDPCRSCDVPPSATVTCPPTSVTPQHAISHVDFCLKSQGGCSSDSECPNDGNPCTTGKCVNHACQQVNNTATCDDANKCTSSDRCASGQCAGTPIAGCCLSDAQCAGDGNPCTTAKCFDYKCKQVNNTNTCNDGNVCTSNDRCSDGQCHGTTLTGCCKEDSDCPGDGNPCTKAKCVEHACVQVNNPAPCNDGNACTSNDACSNGQCHGTPIAGCCSADTDCSPDGLECTSAKCIEHHCVQANNTNSCNDGNTCTSNDTCINGQCLGTPAAGCCNADADCPADGDPCTTAKCVEHRCEQKNNTAGCNDGDACTNNDLCANGQCRGTPIQGCCANHADCAADDNPCTTAKCIERSCHQVPNTATCEGGNECTQYDTCSGGACTPGPQKGDGEPCNGGVCCAGQCNLGASECDEPDCRDLGPAKGYNVFLRGTHTMQFSDIEGCAAAGGIVQLNGVGVGTECAGAFAYVAGNVITLTNGQSNGSVAHAAASPEPVSWNFLGGSFVAAAPIDFEQAFAHLAARGAAFAGLADTAPAQGCESGQVVLSGVLTSRANVFSLSPECLATASSLTIAAPAGATVLVNVRPASGSSGYALHLSNFMIFRQGGITPSGILINALEATSITIQSFQLDGSLLAPNAAVSFSNGNLLGTLVADSLTGNGQFHSHPLFQVCTTPPSFPDPGT